MSFSKSVLAISLACVLSTQMIGCSQSSDDGRIELRGKYAYKDYSSINQECAKNIVDDVVGMRETGKRARRYIRRANREIIENCVTANKTNR